MSLDSLVPAVVLVISVAAIAVLVAGVVGGMVTRGMKAAMGDIRNELALLRTDMTNELAALRKDTAAGFTAVNQRIDQTNERIDHVTK